MCAQTQPEHAATHAHRHHHYDHDESVAVYRSTPPGENVDSSLHSLGDPRMSSMQLSYAGGDYGGPCTILVSLSHSHLAGTSPPGEPRTLTAWTGAPHSARGRPSAASGTGRAPAARAASSRIQCHRWAPVPLDETRPAAKAAASPVMPFTAYRVCAPLSLPASEQI